MVAERTRCCEHKSLGCCWTLGYRHWTLTDYDLGWVADVNLQQNEWWSTRGGGRLEAQVKTLTECMARLHAKQIVDASIMACR